MTKQQAAEILGISINADAKQIRAAYRALAKKYHPDKNHGDAAAAQKFVAVNQANRIMTGQEQPRAENTRKTYYQSYNYKPNAANAAGDGTGGTKTAGNNGRTTSNAGGGARYQYTQSAQPKKKSWRQYRADINQMYDNWGRMNMSADAQSALDKLKNQFNSACRLHTVTQTSFKVCFVTMVTMTITGIIWPNETMRAGTVVYPTLMILCITAGVCSDASEKKIHKLNGMMHDFVTQHIR